jgi:hypothetical protein
MELLDITEMLYSKLPMIETASTSDCSKSMRAKLSAIAKDFIFWEGTWLYDDNPTSILLQKNNLPLEHKANLRSIIQNQRDTLKRKVSLFKNQFVNDICLFRSSAEYFNIMVKCFWKFQ